MNKKIEYQDDNNTYLTVNIIAHNSLEAFPVKYISNTAKPILNNLSNYSVAVDSATIPTDNLPLFWPIIQKYPNINNDLTEYSFTLEYNGIFSNETFAVFISQNPKVYFTPLSANNIIADYDSGYYDVYTIGPILSMLNNCLQSAFSNLSSLVTLPVGSKAPFFTYDYDNNKFELNAQLHYYDQLTLPNPIIIYSNYFMFTIIDKIDFTYLDDNPPNLRFLFNVANVNENVYYKEPSFPPPAPTLNDYYIRMIQDISTVGNLSPVKSICITSSSLPIKDDFIPQSKSRNNINNNQSLLGNETIICEIEPIIKFSPSIIGQEYQYRPNYRIYKDMFTNQSLQRIDITFYWRDIFGVLHYVYSNINKVTTVRLVFSKKELIE